MVPTSSSLDVQISSHVFVMDDDLAVVVECLDGDDGILFVLILRAPIKLVFGKDGCGRGFWFETGAKPIGNNKLVIFSGTCWNSIFGRLGCDGVVGV